MTVDSTLLLIAPEFADTDVGTREAMADLASKSVGAVFGDCTELATAYLTAHMLTISQRAGNGGAVKGLKEGDLSTTYGDTGGATGSLGNTSYGLEYMRIRSNKVFAARTRSV